MEATMGELINLDRGEPASARVAALRVHSALAVVEREIEAVLVGRQRLEGEMSAAAEAKQDFKDKVRGEAASLIEKMKEGVSWTLGRVGDFATLKAAERMSNAWIPAAIGEQALEEAGEELQRLELKRERLRVAQAGITKEVVRESLQPALLADYAVILGQLQETIARLEALDRYLSPVTHDYRPGAARIAISVPDFVKGGGSDQAVIIEARDVARIEAHLVAYAAELAHDPMAPVPELPPLDGPDETIPYHEKSPAERAIVDRDFAVITTQRPTFDSESLKEGRRHEPQRRQVGFSFRAWATQSAQPVAYLASGALDSRRQPAVLDSWTGPPASQTRGSDDEVDHGQKRAITQTWVLPSVRLANEGADRDRRHPWSPPSRIGKGAQRFERFNLASHAGHVEGRPCHPRKARRAELQRGYPSCRARGEEHRRATADHPQWDV
jgi:hypothetical protein